MADEKKEDERPECTENEHHCNPNPLALLEATITGVIPLLTLRVVKDGSRIKTQAMGSLTILHILEPEHMEECKKIINELVLAINDALAAMPGATLETSEVSGGAVYEETKERLDHEFPSMIPG